jgi:hypothetical protein
MAFNRLLSYAQGAALHGTKHPPLWKRTTKRLGVMQRLMAVTSPSSEDAMSEDLKAALAGDDPQGHTGTYEKAVAAVNAYRTAVDAFIPTKAETGAIFENCYHEMHDAIREFHDEQRRWFEAHLLRIGKSQQSG